MPERYGSNILASATHLRSNWLSFQTTYNCVIGFSTLVELKTKKRIRLKVEPNISLKFFSSE
jgi:hypothetical protein